MLVYLPRGSRELSTRLLRALVTIKRRAKLSRADVELDSARGDAPVSDGSRPCQQGRYGTAPANHQSPPPRSRRARREGVRPGRRHDRPLARERLGAARRQRYMSSRHASIDYRSGSYYIVDTSTNGVYVNDSETPVGRGNPQRLFTRRSNPARRVRDRRRDRGDRQHESDSSRTSTTSIRSSKARRVPPPDPTRADLVQPHEITAVGIEMLIQEEAQTSAIRKAAKLAARACGSRTIGPRSNAIPRRRPAARARPEPPPRERRRRAARDPAAQPQPAAESRKPLLRQLRPQRRAPGLRAGLRRARRRLDAFFRGAGLPRSSSTTSKSSRRCIARPNDARAGLGHSTRTCTCAPTRRTRCESRPTIQPQDNEPAQVLGERRRGIAEPAVPPVVGVSCKPSKRFARRSPTSSSTSSLLARAAHRGSLTTSRDSTPRNSKTSSRTASAAPSSARPTSSGTGTSTRTSIRSSRRASRANFRSNSSRSWRARTSTEGTRAGAALGHAQTAKPGPAEHAALANAANASPSISTGGPEEHDGEIVRLAG